MEIPEWKGDWDNGFGTISHWGGGRGEESGLLKR